MRKPDGLTVVAPGAEAAFLAPLPVRRLWGVGPKMEETLAKLGVATIGELAALDPARLARKLGTHGHDLLRLARGEDDREVAARAAGDQEPGPGAHLRRGHRRAGSACARRCCSSPTASRRGCARTALKAPHRHAQVPRRGLPHHHPRAHAASARPTRATSCSGVASELFEEVHGRRRVRLLGIYTSNFGEATPQLGLFERRPSPRQPGKVDRVRDEVAAASAGRRSRARACSAGASAATPRTSRRASALARRRARA